MLVEICIFMLLIFIVLQMNKRPPNFPPGRWGLPILGVFPFPPRGKKFGHFLKGCREDFGDIFSLKVGSLKMVFLCDYHLIKEAFAKLEISGRYPLFTFAVFAYFKNCGILASTGERWMKNRKFLNVHLRQFGLGQATRMDSVIQREVSTILEDLGSKTGTPIRIDYSLNVAVVNVTWELIAARRFGLDDDEIKLFSALVSNNIKVMDGPISLLNFFPSLAHVLPNFVLNGWMKVNVLTDSRDKICLYLQTVIDDHKETLDPENPRDYIDTYLIQMREELEQTNLMFTNEDLRITIMDMFVAGSETTSSLLRWFVLYMAKYQDVQERLFTDISRVIDKGNQPTMQDKEKLPYMDATICELNRMVTLIPGAIPHAVIQDTTLGGYTLPKGTLVTAALEFSHRSPKYWEKPDEFYPDHFLDESGEFITRKDGFFPFSTGRRSCLGESLAKMSLFLFGTSIIQRYKIIPPDGVDIDLNGEPDMYVVNMSVPQDVILLNR